jgi:hypothetical protein
VNEDEAFYEETHGPQVKAEFVHFSIKLITAMGHITAIGLITVIGLITLRGLIRIMGDGRYYAENNIKSLSDTLHRDSAARHDSGPVWFAIPFQLRTPVIAQGCEKDAKVKQLRLKPGNSRVSGG